MKGVVGRVCGRDVEPPMKVSACRVGGDVTGGGIVCGAESLLEIRLGVCGRERSYDS